MLLRKSLLLLALFSFLAVPMMGCTPSAENTDGGNETSTTDESDPGADDADESDPAADDADDSDPAADATDESDPAADDADDSDTGTDDET